MPRINISRCRGSTGAYQECIVFRKEAGKLCPIAIACTVGSKSMSSMCLNCRKDTQRLCLIVSASVACFVPPVRSYQDKVSEVRHAT